MASNNAFIGNFLILSPLFVGVQGARSPSIPTARSTPAGEVPSVIGFLPELKKLDLSFNRLTGAIPASLVRWTFKDSFNGNFLCANTCFIYPTALKTEGVRNKILSSECPLGFHLLFLLLDLLLFGRSVRGNKGHATLQAGNQFHLGQFKLQIHMC